MRKRLLFITVVSLFLLKSIATNAQTLPAQDSLALVDLYNNTNGPGWVHHDNWLTGMPLNQWYGVRISSATDYNVNLDSNNLTGILPETLVNLKGALFISLSQNSITGTIPASFGNFTTLRSLNLSYNQLSGFIPTSLKSFPANADLNITNNKFTFDGLEYLFAVMTSSSNFHLACNPEADIPLRQVGNILSVAAGGTTTNNTYKWYRDNTLLETITGDSTYATGGVPGIYSVEVTNSFIQNNIYYVEPGTLLVIHSISVAAAQDSLALVDFYHSTNGQNWINKTNWLTSEPLATWNGVTVRYGRVTMLNLPDNNLTGSIASSLSNLSNLTTLNLGNNKLSGNIPDLIGSNTQLKDLDLSFNHLSGPIPPTLFNKLTTTNVWLYNNELTAGIPPEIGETKSLEVLMLHNNQLGGSIPIELGKLHNLKALFLDQNQLTGSIPDFFGNMPDLYFVSMYHNQLTGQIPSSIGSLPILRNLILNENQLSGPLPASLSNLHHLDFLDIRNNKLNFDGLETLPPVTFSNDYAPQAYITHDVNNHSGYAIAAGGTPANNTYRFYKDGVLISTKVGDSLFTTNATGRYNITVSNSIATQLTLLSDTLRVFGYPIVNGDRTITKTVSGTNFINIEDQSQFPSVLLATVIPTPGPNTLSGNVTCTITIDPTVATYNNQPYVQRHYDITPASNAANAAATVTLYFTQGDFNNFNNSPSHGPGLPTGPFDSIGIANLRVYQYHGFSASSLPGTYSGSATEIDPDDTRVFWNNLGNYWEVSFEVNGFSGFFISNQSSALLPLNLLSFSAKMQYKAALLQWTTASEVNTARFEIQRSIDGNGFNTVATKMAAGNSSSNKSYQYADMAGDAPVYYYRLKMIDIDEKFSYSKVIKLSHIADEVFNLYPNPAKDFVTIAMAASAKQTTIKLVDMSGRVVQTILLPAGTTQYVIDVKHLSSGAYKIIRDAEKITGKTLIVK